MFPIRTFCITLPETPERTEKAKAHFMERHIQVEFFNGIHAEKFGLKTLHTYEVDAPGSGYSIGFKPTGIWLSHYTLWTVISYLHDDHFFILEVDAKFDEDWHTRTMDALRSVPADFDFLFVGSCCAKQAPQTLVKNQVWEVKYPMCFHAYVVAKKAIPTLLTMRKVWAPIDIQVTGEVFPKLRVFTVLPSIVSQWDTHLDP